MPVKVGRGSNVTTPVVGSTVYVPCPGTTRVVREQFGGVSDWSPSALGSSIAHNVSVLLTRSKLGSCESLTKGLKVWFSSQSSVFASGTAVGTGGGPTVTVIVAFTTRSKESAT